MQIFLAGTYSRPYVFGGIVPDQTSLNPARGQSSINIYLAGVAPWREGGLYDDAIITHRPFILESFYYADEITERLIPYFGDFLLDSGAFTFMQGNHSGFINWDEYVEKYAAFINKNKVEKYFELDVDSVTGYKKVLQMRKDLEKLTGIQPIPVWHKSRGKDEFIRMCDEFPYVALGGIVSKEWSINEHKYFPWFIKNAHDRGCKIHGLGYTNLEGLKANHFDSVDSTAWTTGNRFGYLYKFTGKTIKKVEPPAGCRIKEARKVALMNYLEWIKFQMYAKNNL